MSSPSNTSSCFSSLLAPLYYCISASEEDHGRDSRPLGVAREMKICHNQPHLVPPMKLVFYDDMPSTPHTPPPSQLSQLVSQGKNLASRASGRASLSVRRKTSARPSISAPLPVQSSDDLPFRRRQEYRPLELSIYLPENRLSDLPEFDFADFTADGEIQLPAKALTRSRSVEHLKLPSGPPVAKNPTTSMVGERQLDYWQRRRSSSIISASRPPSAHDTFHSHPVVWSTLPGIPSQANHRQADQATLVTVLSPMQEEFTPVGTPSISHVAESARAEEEMQTEILPSQPEPATTITQQPFKLSKPPTSQKYRTRPESQSRASSFTRNRVSQWLSRSASVATSASGTSSRVPEIDASQLYHCTSMPREHVHCHSHSGSTVATSILSRPESASSLTTMTTAPTVQDLRSRSGTVKSFGKGVVVVEEELPPWFIESASTPKAATSEIPAIGVAF